MKTPHKSKSKVWQGKAWDEHFSSCHEPPSRFVRESIYAHARTRIDTHAKKNVLLPVYLRRAIYISVAAAALLVISARLRTHYTRSTSETIPYTALTAAAIEAGEMWEEETSERPLLEYDAAFENELLSAETTVAWLEQEMAYESTSL